MPRGDEELIHICAAWENTAGSWNFYINGSLVESDLDFAAGQVIASSGIFILGQDQNEFGGGFEQEQSFFGQMYGVNMWDRVLTAEEITIMSTNCTFRVGNFLRWSDFIPGLHGNVKLTSPASCEP